MQRLAARPLLRSLRVHTPRSFHVARAARLSSSVSGSQHPSGPSEPRPPTRPRKEPQPLGIKISTKAALDPAGVYTPSEYVTLQLQSPELQQHLKDLSPGDSALYQSLLERIDKDNGHTDLLALNDIGEFLAERGVEVDMPDAIFEPPNNEIFFDSGHDLDPAYTQISFKDNHPRKIPSLMEPSPLDVRDVLDIPPDKQNPYGGRVIIRNHTSIFDSLPPSTNTSSSSSANSTTSQSFNLPPREVRNLYQSILIARTVKQQTGKGKIMRKQFLVCVGNGNGLIGYGQAKDFNSRLALQKARIEAVRNMDWVERFEERTVWTEMEAKLGATRLIIRPRPVGFGLRCNPFMHQILRAAGFKDISAKVWGSRNKLNVIKAVFRMLHSGHAPVGMGDGVGGKGTRLSKGVGMRGKLELERARGRKLISLRK